MGENTKGNAGVSRRNFVGGLAAAGLLSAGMLAGCAPKGAGDSAAGSASSSNIEKSYDLVILGSGLAGLCAAIRAQENGNSVLLVEKAPSLAGASNSIFSGGALCKPNDESEESIQKFIDVLNIKSKEKGDPGITELLARNITQDLEWLESKGVKIEPATKHEPFDCLKMYVSPGASQGMGILMQTLVDEYTNNGGESLTDTRFLDFVLDNKRSVVGVEVLGKDGVEVIGAKTTVIATGGYVANKQILETYVGPDADEIMVRGSKIITGDGLQAAERIGAMLHQMGGESSLHIGAVVPENVGSGNPSNALGFCLSINSEGKRYTDESLGYVSHGKALMTQPGQVAALIFDADTLQLEKVQQDIARFDSFGSAPVEADTLEELAKIINVPADALVATVAEFNAAIDGDMTKGLAADKAALARPVVTPKFYAFYPLYPGSIMGFGGIYTNSSMDVLRADETPIPGVKVVGEAMGGVFMYDYLAGSSLVRSIVSGIAVADGVK